MPKPSAPAPAPDAIHHLWSPPEPGEIIINMCNYQGIVIIATTRGCYVISATGKPLPAWEIRKTNFKPGT